MIACKEAADRLWSYLDRNLDRKQDEELEQHLGLCRHCCGELEFAKQIRTRLAEGAAELPEDVRGRLERFTREVSS